MTQHVKALLLIASLLVIVYSNALSGEFLWDDEYLLLKNPWIRESVHFKKLFTHDLYAFAPRQTGYYRPLQSLSCVLDHWLYGWKAWGYHLTNIFLHVVAVAGIYGLAFSLGLSSLRALWVSLLFGLHPTLTPAVAYVSGRADPLAMAGSLVCMIGFLRFLQTGAWRHYGLSLFGFIFGLLSKEIVLVLPLLLFWALHLFSKRRFREKFPWLLPYLAVLLLYAGFRIHLFGRLAVSQESPPPLSHLFLFTPKSILLLVKLAFFPFPLYMERYLSMKDPFLGPNTGWGVLFLIGTLWVFQKAPSQATRFGWGWFWVFLLATSPLLLQTHRIAEHFLYFPLVGLIVVLVEGGSLLLSKTSEMRSFRWGAGVFLVGILVVFSLKTYQRNLDWQDPETFYQSILRHDPESATASNNLGRHYSNQGQWKKAETFLGRAIAANPEFVEPYYNLAFVFRSQGRFTEAIFAYEKVLSLKPDLAAAHHFLAECYAKDGREQDAERERRWLREHPH